MPLLASMRTGHLAHPLDVERSSVRDIFQSSRHRAPRVMVIRPIGQHLVSRSLPITSLVQFSFHFTQFRTSPSLPGEDLGLINYLKGRQSLCLATNQVVNM